MKIRYAFLMLFASGIAATGAAQQNKSDEVGKMTLPEFVESESLKSYGTDAVVIYRNGHYSFLDDEDFMTGIEPFPVFRSELVTRIKILSDEGTRYGVFEFPYYNFSYNVPVFDLEGYTYNLESNGTLSVIPLGKNDTEDIVLDGDFRLRRVVFPNVRKGSVVELRCVERSKHSRMPEWRFQQHIPVLASELVYIANPYLGYAARLKGAKKYSYMDRKTIQGDQRAAYVSDPDHLVYIYGMDSMPAYPREDYTNNADDEIIRVVFDNVAKVSPRTGAVVSVNFTWSQFNSDLAKEKNFGKYIKSSEKEYSKIKNTPSDKSVTGDMAAIFNYVRDNYRWNGINSPYASQRVSEFVKRRVGNSADLNLFLTGLLRAAGMDAVPVLIRTRNSGSIDKEIPSAEAFNYAVVSVTADDMEYFLDATEPFALFAELPERSANVEGLYATSGNERWTFTKQEQFAYDNRSADGVIDIPGSVMEVSVTRTFEGNAAVNVRSCYVNRQDDLPRVLGEGHDVEIKNISSEDYASPGTPLVIQYQYSQPVEMDDDGVVKVLPFMMLAPDSNPFSCTAPRRFPVNIPFRPMDSYSIHIAVPEGYEVLKLPQEVTVNDDVSFFSYCATQQGNDVVVEAEYYLCDPVYPAGLYSVLQQKYDDILKKLGESIIFNKSDSSEAE